MNNRPSASPPEPGGFMMPIDAFRRIFTDEQQAIIMPRASLFGEFIQWRMIPPPSAFESRLQRGLVGILYHLPDGADTDGEAMDYLRHVCAGDRRPRVPVNYIGTPNTDKGPSIPTNQYGDSDTEDALWGGLVFLGVFTATLFGVLAAVHP